MFEWGIQKYGAKLTVDPVCWPQGFSPVFIDVETNGDEENPQFVGLGMCFNDKEVYYFTKITPELSMFLSRSKIVGHNIKGDAKWLKGWGVDIIAPRIQDDTILMSYVINTTKPSHSLKDLGKELGYVWPAYKELVGKGKDKTTLDKQPVELTSNYCAMDVFVTYKLYQYFVHKMDIAQRTNYVQIELPLMKVLYQSELQGVRIDTALLSKLSDEFTKKHLVNETKIKDLVKQKGFSSKNKAGKELKFNPNSSTQKGKFLNFLEYDLPFTKTGKYSTAKGVLQKLAGDPIIDLFLEFNKIKKLLEFLAALVEIEKNGKVYPTYNQIRQSDSGDEVGMSTSRLSCSKPNIQQIPTKSEEGNLLRGLFIPSDGKVFVDADFSQIEPRLTAHFSQDPFLMSIFREGKDLYDSLSEGIIPPKGVEGKVRDVAKQFWLAKSYGAMEKKLAALWKCSIEEAQDISKGIEDKIPNYIAWVNRVRYEAGRKLGIYTLNKRWIPIPEINCADVFEHYYWERFAVNSTIQGSAAEIWKKAVLALKQKGYLMILGVHDEILVEVDKNDSAYKAQEIKQIMESCVDLSVPLIADVGIGSSWKEAKK
jgi:DNA polymerase-1